VGNTNVLNRNLLEEDDPKVRGEGKKGGPLLARPTRRNPLQFFEDLKEWWQLASQTLLRIDKNGWKQAPKEMKRPAKGQKR